MGGAGLSTNRYVQLATGLNRPEDKIGDWIPAAAVWETTDEGFIIARQTAHQIILAANLNTEGAADVLTASGVRLRATPLGLMYVGTSAEPAVGLANLKDCVGEQISDTDVIYRDAFDSLHADVRFRLGLDRLELDQILRQSLPPPEAFGLNRRSARLVVVTEFFDSVTPVVLRETTVGESSDARPALVDEWLGFGDMEMVPGRAFALDADPMASGVPVGKSWQQDDRSLLFETVEYTSLEPLLDALPAYDQARLRPTTPPSLAGNGRPLPAPGLRPRAVPNTFALASVNPRRSTQSPLSEAPGVVLDWALLTSQTSVTLAGNVTYRVSGSVNVQNLTVEGGSVVKYDPAGSVYVSGSVACRTGP